MYAARWFKYGKVVIEIFVDGVALVNSMITTVTHTAEANRDKEYTKRIDTGLDLEAEITESFSTVLPSILLGNMKEVADRAYECFVI